MLLRITASRHSAFYSPLLSCVEFLCRAGHDVVYGVLGPGQKSYVLLGNGDVEVMQSAVSSNWKLMDRGIEPLPVHFAQINRRDGFFLVGREPDVGPEPAAVFDFRKLEGATLLAGREFEDTDDAVHTHVAIVDDTVADSRGDRVTGVPGEPAQKELTRREIAARMVDVWLGHGQVFAEDIESTQTPCAEVPHHLGHGHARFVCEPEDG